jgi:hypothetical protein
VPADAIQQEYMCEFMDLTAGVFDMGVVERALTATGAKGRDPSHIPVAPCYGSDPREGCDASQIGTRGRLRARWGFPPAMDSGPD